VILYDSANVTKHVIGSANLLAGEKTLLDLCNVILIGQTALFVKHAERAQDVCITSQTA
jgi:hypothetical protein